MTDRRNVEHIRSWQEATRQLATRHRERLDAECKKIEKVQEEVADRDAKILELRTNVKALTEETQRVLTESMKGQAQQPNERVLGLLANTVAEQAIAEKEEAFRIRNFAMARLWVVDEIHHGDEENNDLCTCGQPLQKCRTYEALTPMRNSINKWSNQQFDRLKKNWSHGLPPEHPEVIKQRSAAQKTRQGWRSAGR